MMPLERSVRHTPEGHRRLISAAMSVRVVLLVVSAPFASALLPALALPAAPVIAGAAASLLAFTGVRRAQRNEKAFFSMDWSQEVPDTDDACAIIGEETVENGKIWCAP